MVVEKIGDDLPLKKNLANHLDDNGHCDVLLFFDDHRRSATCWNLERLIQAEMLIKPAEARLFVDL